jgi:integrase
MAVSLDPKSNKLVIRFRVKGYSKQFYLSTGLKDNKSNRAIVETRWELIQREISLNEFDPTLERYRFGNKRTEKKEVERTELTVIELWDKFTNFKSQLLEPTSIYNYEVIAKLLPSLPSSPVEIRNYLLANHSYSRAKEVIDYLSRCFDWAVESGLTNENKFKLLKLPTRKKSSNEKISAYTLEQRDLIIYHFENHHKFNHYANLIKFLFWSGCRPGEAFALTWGDISLDCTKITINKSYASREKLIKGTKNGKRRVFPATSGGKLQLMLMGMRGNQKPSDLIFLGLSGQPMTLRILDKTWRGNQVGKYFYPGVVRHLADKKIIPFLKVYAARHTFATWAIATGSTPDKVAYWLGDSIETVLEFYCHPEVSKSDCPDF